MDKKFLVKLAYKNLMTRRLRTILTLTGIIIGISAIVFLVAFAFGLERLITREVTSGNAFQLLDVGTGNSQVIKLNDEAITKIESVQYVKSVEPAISVGAKAKKTNTQIDATIFGASAKYLKWGGARMRWGSFYSESQTDSSTALPEAVVNTAYTQFMGGDDPSQYLNKTLLVDIVVPKAYSGTGEDKIIENQQFKILGVIKDETAVKIYTHYKNIAALGITDYSQLKVELTRSSEAQNARKVIENMGYKTQYVGDTVAQIEQIFNVFKVILASFGFVALVVAALGMFNTLTISLLERIKEIALMKILGMRKKDINNLFLAEAIVLGVVGGVIGMIMGIIFGLLANQILNFFAIRAGGDPVQVFYFSPLFMIGIFLFSILLGLITGLYPAKRATRVNPLDVLRYE